MEISGIDERCIRQLITFDQGIIQFWDKERTVVDSYAFIDATIEEVLAFAIEQSGDNPFEVYAETTGNPLGHPECKYFYLPFERPWFSVKDPRPDQYHPPTCGTWALSAYMDYLSDEDCEEES